MELPLYKLDAPLFDWKPRTPVEQALFDYGSARKIIFSSGGTFEYNYSLRKVTVMKGVAEVITVLAVAHELGHATREGCFSVNEIIAAKDAAEIGDEKSKWLLLRDELLAWREAGRIIRALGISVPPTLARRFRHVSLMSYRHDLRIPGRIVRAAKVGLRSK